MSAHDAYMQQAAPHLLQELGTAGTITVLQGDHVVLNAGDAILGPVKTEQRLVSSMELTQVRLRAVYLLVDESHPHKGLSGEHLHAQALIDGEAWTIVSIAARNSTWQRLDLEQHAGISRVRSGFYDAA